MHGTEVPFDNAEVSLSRHWQRVGMLTRILVAGYCSGSIGFAAETVVNLTAWSGNLRSRSWSSQSGFQAENAWRGAFADGIMSSCGEG